MQIFKSLCSAAFQSCDSRHSFGKLCYYNIFNEIPFFSDGKVPKKIKSDCPGVDGFFTNLFSNENFAIKACRCNIMPVERSGIMVLKID